jgi:hypothetical protein
VQRTAAKFDLDRHLPGRRRGSRLGRRAHRSLGRCGHLDRDELRRGTKRQRRLDCRRRRYMRDVLGAEALKNRSKIIAKKWVQSA